MAGVQVVIALAPGHGHLYPTFGLANEMASRGHRVVYAMVDEPVLRARVEAEGHRFAPVPPELADQREIVEAGLRKNPTLAGIFGPLAAPAVGPLVRLIAEVEARLVLHDMASFAAPLAAAIAGVPSSHIGVGPSFPDEAREAGRLMAPLWGEWGQRSDELAGMFRLAYFDPFPPSLDNPARSLGMPLFSYRPMPLSSLEADDALGLPPPPWVWATLGTVFNKDGRAWDRLAEELARIGPNVLVTVGDGAAPSPQLQAASNLVVRTFVPAEIALAGASAVLCHGGAGTLLGALRQGLPVVCWPQGADQFHNARTCEEAGAGIEVVDAAGAAGAIRLVLADGHYRSAAERLRDEIMTMPSPSECVGVLEDLAGTLLGP
jgi:UDP:flavonoid glycosyltransferase YjiC (YdhE family)